MKLVYFTHSLASCWNHGNAHFLRGVLRELRRAGHEVLAFEPARRLEPREPAARPRRRRARRLPRRLSGPRLPHLRRSRPKSRPRWTAPTLVIVHEWNEPALVAALGRAAAPRRPRFTLLFHDTHHRAVSDPEAIRRFDLDGYDGVLAFGEALAEVYRRWGWGERVFVWHEAADTRLFRPPEREAPARGPGLDRQLGRRRAQRRAGKLPAPPGARRPACRSTSTASATPSTPCARSTTHGARYRGWLPNAARAGGLRPPPRHRARAAPLLRATSCPASRPSASSRRWPAASPSSPRPGDDAEGLFRPGRGLPGGARRGRDGAAHGGASATTPDCAARWRERARGRSAPGTAARTARRNCSASCAAWACVKRRRSQGDSSTVRLQPDEIRRRAAALGEWFHNIDLAAACGPRPTTSSATTRP